HATKRPKAVSNKQNFEKFFIPHLLGDVTILNGRPRRLFNLPYSSRGCVKGRTSRTITIVHQFNESTYEVAISLSSIFCFVSPVFLAENCVCQGSLGLAKQNEYNFDRLTAASRILHATE